MPFLPGRDQFFDVHQIRGIVARVAGVAILVAVVRYSLAKRPQRKISQRIGFHEAANLLHVVMGGYQLGARRRIHAVEAGRNGGALESTRRGISLEDDW